MQQLHTLTHTHSGGHHNPKKLTIVSQQPLETLVRRLPHYDIQPPPTHPRTTPAVATVMRMPRDECISCDEADGFGVYVENRSHGPTNNNGAEFATNISNDVSDRTFLSALLGTDGRGTNKDNLKIPITCIKEKCPNSLKDEEQEYTP